MKKFMLVLGVLALAGCLPQDDPPGPKSIPAKKAACEAAGGTYAPGGIFSPEYICFTENPDAGKSCRKATDCTDTCLADTRTCNKVSPMFGCYSYLDEKGKKVEICVD
ncbi:hypothetical protein E7681_04325 [Thalassobius vesicularis]|uniref:Lipoprotein n=1 Tax=Thalassobius vesicularis TaxID=1294297 RepID=A0A4S3MDV2_9RHOB|nr:hypothetical protein [Thalassobius vesicularis]THD75688.1 hypothetical protein E7681_04325 [Thalassobius vesicularis]